MVESGELFQALNSKNKNLEVNTQIITLTDNLSHPYFSFIKMSKNNSSPVGVAVLEAPYAPQISDYWIKYKGAVVISFEMTSLNQTNTNSSDYLKKYKLKQRINNNQYNYSFVGRVGQFKQKGKKFIVHIEDIGWKFLQKVPKEFRDSYIANQPLGKAFQAICEFIGVQFAYSIEDLNEYTFGADGYSVTKDGQVVEDVETILSKWKMEDKEDEENENSIDNQTYENKELIDLDKKNKNNKRYVKKSNDKNKVTEKNDDDKSKEEVDKYQEEFDKKILDLFIGNSYYESDVDSNNLDYNSITITPVSGSETTNSTMEKTENDEEKAKKKAKQISKKILDRGKSGISLSNLTFK